MHRALSVKAQPLADFILAFAQVGAVLFVRQPAHR